MENSWGFVDVWRAFRQYYHYISLSHHLHLKPGYSHESHHRHHLHLSSSSTAERHNWTKLTVCDMVSLTNSNLLFSLFVMEQMRGHYIGLHSFPGVFTLTLTQIFTLKLNDFHYVDIPKRKASPHSVTWCDVRKQWSIGERRETTGERRETTGLRVLSTGEETEHTTTGQNLSIDITEINQWTSI